MGKVKVIGLLSLLIVTSGFSSCANNSSAFLGGLANGLNQRINEERRYNNNYPSTNGAIYTGGSHGGGGQQNRLPFTLPDDYWEFRGVTNVNPVFPRK